MCDAGRLNYKWIGRDDRLGPRCGPERRHHLGLSVLKAISDHLAKADEGSVAIVASARQTNEELYLLNKLAKHFKALTDSVPRNGEADHLLVVGDRTRTSPVRA
ncbi:MAG: hypothetical protein CM1200mP29_01860 [Verrucomicrobiota bacterium]|nr:MAG: hypothetical protein CM1200mP29_01860 [Verrucomicrobiota bacterium]